MGADLDPNRRSEPGHQGPGQHIRLDDKEQPRADDGGGGGIVLPVRRRRPITGLMVGR